MGLRGVPLRNDDLNEIQVVSAHFMKNTIAYSPLEFQFIGPYAWVVFYIPKLIVMTKSAENIEKKIEAQLEKLKQLKAQKQAIEARERTKQNFTSSIILSFLLFLLWPFSSFDSLFSSL